MRLVKTLGQNLGQILPKCFYRFLEKVGFHDTLRPALGDLSKIYELILNDLSRKN